VSHACEDREPPERGGHGRTRLRGKNFFRRLTRVAVATRGFFFARRPLSSKDWPEFTLYKAIRKKSRKIDGQIEFVRARGRRQGRYGFYGAQKLLSDYKNKYSAVGGAGWSESLHGCGLEADYPTGDAHSSAIRSNPHAAPAAGGNPRPKRSPRQTAAVPQRRFAGTATSISFGFGSFRLFISATYSSMLCTCSRGFQRRSSPIVDAVQPL
jgi:hypothetical protein